MNFKLGFGPMSREVITSIATYSKEKNEPLMLIASRNQIDAESGYVMTTPELRQLLSTLPTENLWICRDHCGPYFLDVEKGLPLRDAVEASKKTIAYDIEQGFDLIHIDTSRVDDTYGIAEELFDFSYKKNPTLRFEFGTEENVGVAAGIIQYKKDVAFAKNMPNIYTVVAQTGSLCHEDHQHGEFNYQAAIELVQVANENGVKLKEHNADYLTAAEVRMRKDAGVHTLNIAPQLGVAQTKLLRVLSSKHAPNEWQQFADVVLASGKWSKWTDLADPTQKVSVAGHYCYSSLEYQTLINKLINAGVNWQQEVDSVIYDILDTYTVNLR
jgi:tagatose-1,6-bisphosphate aldolase non-catalytic subunit AgaZ/GatZ